jgi:hypothetical protein
MNATEPSMLETLRSNYDYLFIELRDPR